MEQPTFRERLRYAIDQFFQRSFTLQVAIAFSLVVTIVLLFTAIAHVLGVVPGPDFDFEAPGVDPFWPSIRFWWVLMHVFDTYWIERGTTEFVLSMLLTLINYLVFAGVIGLVGSKIAARLESVRRGTSRVIESRHFVILGWSEKIFPIIQQLALGLEREKAVFVILSLRPVDEMETELRRALGKRRDVRWVIRSGSPTDMKALDLLSIPTSRAVVILQPEGESQTPTAVAADTQVVKCIINVSHILSAAGVDAPRAPLIIAELGRPEMFRISLAAGGKHAVRVIHPAEYIGKILVQTARQRGVIDVYRQIFSHEENELHIGRFPQFDGMPWRDVVMSFRQAIPVGVVEGGRARLLPFRDDPGKPLASGSSIIALARDERAFRDIEEVRRYAPSTGRGGGSMGEDIRRYLILGYDGKVLRILQELEAYAEADRTEYEVFVASPYLPDPFPEEGIASLSLRAERCDFLHPGVIERLRTFSFDSIIVLGESDPGRSAEETDARVVMTLLLLQALREGEGASTPRDAGKPYVVAEIRNPSNYQLAVAAGCAGDIVITNELISKMIAQICREPLLESVLHDILDEKGVEIYFKPMSRYAPSGQRVPFGALLAASLELGEIALGFVAVDRTGAASSPLVLNPARETLVDVLSGSQLCVLAESER
ncbi:MAG: hypothetical protein QHI48_04055 [Bacteroidota bacterium]|nr:hypothetical protein [Bacteroidota bacterium]